MTKPLTVKEMKAREQALAEESEENPVIQTEASEVEIQEDEESSELDDEIEDDGENSAE